MLCFKQSYAIFTILTTCKCYVNIYRSIHKVSLNMNSAYLFYVNGEDQFKLSFLYKKKEMGIDRQFNFCRLLKENVDTFVGRISSNVGKIVQKKVNKKVKKTKVEEGASRPNVDLEVKLLNNGIPVCGTLTCYDVFFNNSHVHPLILQIDEINYSVIINCPWINSISLPNSIMSGFPVYPSKFEVQNVDRLKSSFSWMKNKIVASKSVRDANWELVGSDFMYTPTQNDIGSKLKIICTPYNQEMSGPTVEAETETVVEAGPGICPFETRHAFTKNRLGSGRVLSYNILADMYASTDDARDILFPYCAKYALNIDYRKQLFVKEILGYNADIICLQEVDVKIYDMDLTTVFGGIGYEGNFAKKTTASEGLSCFYPASRFKCLESHMITYGEELKAKKEYCSHIWKAIENITSLVTKMGDLGTCGQVLVLESLDQPGEILVVSNTHLYFHPDADHIRLLQAGILIAFLQEVVETVTKKNVGKHVSLLMCGDFNSVPENGIYKLMTTREVPEDLMDWKSKEGEAVLGLTLRQPYSLKSACGPPKYTDFTVGFADCLDYIFFQTDRLKVDQVIPMPSEEELRVHIAIPSVVFPSDHIALVADLKWR